MNWSVQRVIESQNAVSAFACNARASFIGSKIIRAIGVEPERLDAVHNAIWLRLINDETCLPNNECDALAAKIVAVALTAELATAEGGAKAAMATVMRESGQSIDPLIAENFLRLASSPIFWMALDSAGEARDS